ncbi:cyclase [Paenibacillus sp. FSL H8-0548]|uniref:cyclase family protein n=1 Tax=Paenibacillus sp. FSL H8-0548 TaxID=1920422 RepID=UPI00097003CF|nr:cyclase family protein [Paenibacillus sp. FSL H8-0548]OMF24154.1 cyclase [Paenibacillus sp. FSL H8-0548]
MIIDLTHSIQEEMPIYPGDADTVLEHSKQFSKDGYNNHQLSINMHAGTHIDGPMHLLDIQKYIHEYSLDRFLGDAVLLNVAGEKSIDYKEEYEEIMKDGQIVVIYTGHSDCYGQPEYFTEYPALTAEFAQLLVRKKVKMIGLDTPSPDYAPFDIHNIFFENDMLIIENLTNIEQLLDVKAFEIIALPLAIRADSSIARVIARVKE